MECPNMLDVPRRILKPEMREKIINALYEPSNYAPKLTIISKNTLSAISTVDIVYKKVFSSCPPFVNHKQQFAVQPEHFSYLISALTSKGAKIVGVRMTDRGLIEADVEFGFRMKTRGD